MNTQVLKGVATSLHITIFVLSLYPLLMLVLFQDAPNFSFSLLQKFFIGAVISYPIILIVASILSRFNTWFFYLPFINFIIVIYVLAPLFYSGVVDSVVLGNKIKTENIKNLQEATRDFICDNGSFFDIEEKTSLEGVELDGIKIVYYYDKEAIKNPGKYGALKIGYIKDGISDLDPDRYIWKTQIKEGLESCKNKDGKSLLEVYPEK